MESFFVRFKNPLILITILLAQAVGLAIQVRRPADPTTLAVAGPRAVTTTSADPRTVSLVRYWVTSVASPFERFFFAIGHNVRSGWSNYIDLRHTRQQNAALQQQLGQMRLEQAAIAQDALQGQRLQALLSFQKQYVTSTVPAQVIGTSGSDLSRILYIDKGREDGLKPDQAVITPDGIVGKLRDVFPHTAQVLLIDDQTSGAGVLLASTRIRGILRGTSTGRVIINNLTSDDRIKSGETILTSGGDQVFPRGLPVGTIQSIALDPDHQPYTLIEVRPAANLSQLEEVLVITGTQSDLPISVRQDLAVGAATAEIKAQAQAQARAAAARAAELKAIEDAHSATHSAAQIVADRLPSLHDADHPDPATTGKPSDPRLDPTSPLSSKVPRPLPTLHPDRYTPGTTPSAAELTPGAANPPAQTDSRTTSPATPHPAASRPTLPRSTTDPSLADPAPKPSPTRRTPPDPSTEPPTNN